MIVAGLFAGIGGLERGLSRAGHHTRLLVEIDPGAQAVLQARFPQTELHGDIQTLRALPADVDLVAAGFPCQDLSQAGQTRGLSGAKSSLVHEVFRLLRRRHVDWVLLENVPFMLSLNRGAAIRAIADQFEDLGYAWAYRTLDTRAFGLPQRRERVFLLASRLEHPAHLLFQDEASPAWPEDHTGRACGFYWTEGLRGLGWAVDALPTLKGGSTIGIPSPPAFWTPDGQFFTPGLPDAERLQGFPAHWTAPLEHAGLRASLRWKLVGNAVSVPVAEWLGRLLASGVNRAPTGVTPLPTQAAWPAAGFGHRRHGRHAVNISKWPVARRNPGLAAFLRHPAKALSQRASAGFLSRLNRSALWHPPEFRHDLERYCEGARS